jgi:peptidoglycan-associated lipoprotein
MLRAKAMLKIVLACAALLACGSSPKKRVAAVPERPAAASAQPSPAATTGDMTITSSTHDDLSWLAPVYFAFDSAELTAETRATLVRLHDWLAAHPKAGLTVEGHCDELGTTEYNIALGQRRAQAITDYLVRLGIATDRVRPVSYGSEHPAAEGHDEVAWSKNRRGELRPSP